MREKKFALILGIAFGIYLGITIVTVHKLYVVQNEFYADEITNAKYFINEYLDSYGYNDIALNIEILNAKNNAVCMKAITANDFAFIIIHDSITDEYTVSEETQ